MFNQETIKVSLLSMGMSGTVFHAPFFSSMPEFDLVSVWERQSNIAAEKYPSVKVYKQLDELLSDAHIELVVVNTPNVTHFEIAKKCLQAGKHVIVEKPFTPTVLEANELIQLSMEKNRMLSVFHNRRWDSDFLTVKKVLESGDLGEIKEVEIHFDRFGSQLSPKEHKEAPKKGTGILYDLGSHIIDQALLLFGMPDAVMADLMWMRPGTLVDDYFELLLYYHDFRVRLKGTYQALEPLPAYVIHGSKGTFIKARGDVQENELKAGRLPNEADWGREPQLAQGKLYLHAENGTIIHDVATEKGIHQQQREHQSLPSLSAPPAATGYQAHNCRGPCAGTTLTARCLHCLAQRRPLYRMIDPRFPTRAQLSGCAASDQRGCRRRWQLPQ